MMLSIALWETCDSQVVQHCSFYRIRASALCFDAAVMPGWLKTSHGCSCLSHVESVLQTHVASVSSDASLQQLLLPNQPLFRRTSACALEFFGAHPIAKKFLNLLLLLSGSRSLQEVHCFLKSLQWLVLKSFVRWQSLEPILAFR